jgi:ssDNA-binding Zn-finger/Zn-ribbon topoisomerase 1
MKCLKCSGDGYHLVKGKHGWFWGCNNYPKCKASYPINVSDKCPECGKSLEIDISKSYWRLQCTSCHAPFPTNYIYPDNGGYNGDPSSQEEASMYGYDSPGMQGYPG